LLAYALVLAAFMGVIYANSVASSAGNLISINNRSGEILGHRLFGGFLVAQAGIWMLLPAALTAPSIAGERERGLLQGVLLSSLSSGAIVRGKLISALWFITLLLLVPMPIISLCFTLGGLSPAEFIIAFALLGSTAFSGACLGLATSACHRRSDASLLTAFFITLTLSWPPVLVAATFEQNFFTAGAIICVLYQGILAAAALGVASDALNNILPEPETEAIYTPATLQKTIADSPTDTINSIFLGREEDLSYNRAALYPDSLPPVVLNPRRLQGAQVERATPTLQTWKDTTLSGKLNFRNPVLQREVRVRLRRRVQTVPAQAQGNPVTHGNELHFYSRDFWAISVGLTLLLGLNGLVLRIGALLSVLWILGAMLLAAALGALSFVREREQLTLQPLLLTMLSPGEVLMGKMGAACIAGTFYALPFLPLVLLCTLTQWRLWPVLLILGVAALCCGAALGLAISWICRQSGVAVASALTAALTCFVATWQLCAYSWKQGVSVPGASLPNYAISLSTYPALFWYALPVCGLWLFSAAFFLFVLHGQLRPQAMEKREHRFLKL
jgi:ABC-type transport system involved in multi-copper enzyme maturation permease subunit